jgi:hypothetical protein
MATRLKIILTFTNVAPGASLAIAHELNWLGRAVKPDLILPSVGGFSFVATTTTVTATNNGLATATAQALCVSWHTYERDFGNQATTVLTPQPFIPDLGASNAAMDRLVGPSVANPPGAENVINFFISSNWAPGIGAPGTSPIVQGGSAQNDGLSATTPLDDIPTFIKRYPLEAFAGARARIWLAGIAVDGSPYGFGTNAPGGGGVGLQPGTFKAYTGISIPVGGAECERNSYLWRAPKTLAGNVLQSGTDTPVFASWAEIYNAATGVFWEELTFTAPGWTAADQFIESYAWLRVTWTADGVPVIFDTPILSNTTTKLRVGALPTIPVGRPGGPGAGYNASMTYQIVVPSVGFVSGYNDPYPEHAITLTGSKSCFREQFIDSPPNEVLDYERTFDGLFFQNFASHLPYGTSFLDCLFGNHGRGGLWTRGGSGMWNNCKVGQGRTAVIESGAAGPGSGNVATPASAPRVDEYAACSTWHPGGLPTDPFAGIDLCVIGGANGAPALQLGDVRGMPGQFWARKGVWVRNAGTASKGAIHVEGNGSWFVNETTGAIVAGDGNQGLGVKAVNGGRARIDRTNIVSTVIVDGAVGDLEVDADGAVTYGAFDGGGKNLVGTFGSRICEDAILDPP